MTRIRSAKSFRILWYPRGTFYVKSRKAYEAKPAAGVGAAAHKLKSSSRAVGANALADLRAELEAAGKSDGWDAIKTHIPHLGGLMQAATEYIKAL